ncbi:MAG TPA: NAD(P)/FAD-dependent oxidoreductase [Gemmatimonadaceae bacterium]|jgi:cation diffusion facilitator CzcD-associated flavoprotein CzcO|nr:NAD(P)/FAD-dependent oxidoreductase [Gemmatimonadaceae bacterium]
MSRADVIVVGAGASGLAVAATLKRRGRDPVVIDAGKTVGATWAQRYERLHLHTVRRFSGLPFYPMPRSYPRYVPKDQYARYLAEYAERMGLGVRLGERVERIRVDGAGWVVETAQQSWTTRAVIVATGRHNVPRIPRWPGMEDFKGRVLHSQQYSSGREFTGKRVLVIGIGNTGAEIAADLVEQGAARVAVAVRSTPPITSREIAGIPVQLLGMLLAPFPSRVVDRLGALLRRFGNGDLSKYGLGKEAWGPFTARRPPVIDVGFLELLKAGRIDVLGDVQRFTKTGAVFADGGEAEFDVVVAATGFTSGLEQLLSVPNALDDRGYPGADHAYPGLYFAGYSETPRGQLFESSGGANKLAASVSSYLEKSEGK